MLAARGLVAGKGGCQPQAAVAPARPPLPLSWGSYPHAPCPSPVQVTLALQPHLVKRSQGRQSSPSSGADQWQSIFRMLLVRQVRVPAPSPGKSDRWEPIAAASGQGWGRGAGLAVDTLAGQCPDNDTRNMPQGQDWETRQVMGSNWDTWMWAGPWRTGPSTVWAKRTPWSLTEDSAVPEALPHPPPTVSSALTFSFPGHRDSQADPGADQEPSTHPSPQSLTLQGPTCKGQDRGAV